MNKKEQTPLIVHKALESYLDKKGKLFVKIASKEDLIRFRGSSAGSNFFFHIKSHKKNDNKNQILISYQSHTEESVEPRSAWVNCNRIKGHFDLWHTIINGYSETKTVFDDPIINGFEEEYFSFFEIIEDEKDKPLAPSSILPLYEHFKDLSNKLENCKNEENTLEIEDIQEDIEQLNKNLTTSGRQEIAQRVCKILAKLTKQGVKYISEFVEVSRKFVMKEAAKRIFKLGQKGIEYIDEIDKYLN